MSLPHYSGHGRNYWPMPQPSIAPIEHGLRRMFASAISKCRRDLGLSQEALAELTDMSTSYI